jgi:hypothetical protein
MVHPGHPAQRDEPDPGVAGEDLPALLGADPDHHPGAQLESLLAGDEHRGALQRDVDLLLAGLLGGLVVVVVGVAV